MKSTKMTSKIKKLMLSAALALTLLACVKSPPPPEVKILPGDHEPQVNWNS